MNNRVVIAGGGPVGLMLACELGLAGVETVLFERCSQPREESPGIATNATVIELLDQRGLLESIRADGIEFSESQFSLLPLDPTRTDEWHVHGLLVPHSTIERRLAERAAEFGVDIRHGHELVALTQDEAGVTVTTRSDGKEHRTAGRYLVGCDGVDSTVRGLAGIGFPGTEPSSYGIVGDVNIELTDQLLQVIGNTLYPTGILTVLPSDAGRLREPRWLRIILAEYGGEPVDSDAPVTLEELRAALLRVANLRWEPTGQPRWLSRWDSATRHADRYREGNVFLAGEAAHTQFPLSGQPLATGIEDAVNLGWKLAASIQGWGLPDLLGTYHRERHPVGARMCMTTRAQEVLVYPEEKVSPLRTVLAELIEFDQVNQYLINMQAGLDLRYPVVPSALAGEEGTHPLQGRRLPPVSLKTAEGDSDTARLLHSGRGVLLDLSGGTANVEDAVAGWRERIDSVTAEPTPGIEANALLLRPDGRVAWADSTGSGIAGLRVAARTWFGEPARVHSSAA